MNSKLIKLSFVYGIIFICKACAHNDNISLYLGQLPPESTPKIFAPGIVSNEEHHEFSCTFSPNGNELYFNRNMQIMVCKWEVLILFKRR